MRAAASGTARRSSPRPRAAPSASTSTRGRDRVRAAALRRAQHPVRGRRPRSAALRRQVVRRRLRVRDDRAPAGAGALRHGGCARAARRRAADRVDAAGRLADDELREPVPRARVLGGRVRGALRCELPVGRAPRPAPPPDGAPPCAPARRPPGSAQAPAVPPQARRARAGTKAMAEVSSEGVEIGPELDGATELIAVCRA